MSHLLLVEDNEINVKVMERFLEKWGYSYDVAVNGAIGVELFTTQKYDLILLDLQMPVMDGYTATKLIREKNKEIPIIVITAQDVLSAVEKIIEYGWNDMIVKPFEPDVVKNKIEQLISKCEKS